ncbi:uncharacterized protein LACBIDRAFT_335398 [Laccaria bicolor S238N-H82]|uniref:Predicted protein n=1 Tax=Laccaria bicolor (strain S238N-H82 / ATCC MYA-4686) TaxID=486041 RepID=B0E282_LACBS|nr:uncharacterized protein LACBIDRAFT_335398 [Laccaria bicolor S238N-H82]EDQ99051.1 predicted protein [Laccaria bicolor S238N-H82]|eukprot:XP_001890294.1 predicted protein [Laccaria bicolor S238N-H82]
MLMMLVGAWCVVRGWLAWWALVDGGARGSATLSWALVDCRGATLLAVVASCGVVVIVVANVGGGREWKWGDEDGWWTGFHYIPFLCIPRIIPVSIPECPNSAGMGGTDKTSLERVLTPEVTQEILWELCHMSFQFELLSLDALLADTLYHGRWGVTDAEAARSRSEQLLRVFPLSGDVLGSFMINEIPNCDLGLTSFDLEEWNRHLVELGRLMCPWKGCPDSIKDASHLPIEAHVQALEEACTSFYCQSFFDNFGRAPIIPCRLPRRSLATQSQLALQIQ